MLERLSDPIYRNIENATEDLPDLRGPFRRVGRALWYGFCTGLLIFAAPAVPIGTAYLILIVILLAIPNHSAWVAETVLLILVGRAIVPSIFGLL